MNKTELIEIFNDAKNYAWSLYFFSINKRSENLYNVFKVHMKNDMIENYTKNLLSCISKFQLEKIDTIDVYNGENPKLSCDELNLDSEIIKENWNIFLDSCFHYSEEKLENKIKGYFLYGQPQENSGHKLTVFKIANPVFDIKKNKRATIFKKVDNELDAISDDLYRLYLNIDFFVIDNNLYALNYKFEEIFDIEKTMQRLKSKSIKQILKLKCFADDNFKNFLESYNRLKTFITLNNERINMIKNTESRKEIANRFNIELDENNNFNNLSDKQSQYILDYLCYKIIIDGDNSNLVEVTQATKLEIEK